MTSEPVFALDIGTRKVMGILAEPQGPELEIIDSETREHPARAMNAGEIQDASEVVRVVRQVVEALERRGGRVLRRAAVAVAGRNLKTLTGAACVDRPENKALESQDLHRAVFAALEPLLPRLGASYSCVGYAVKRWKLDGRPVDQPLGLRGGRLEAEVLATFLPRSVLESQITVLERAGLEAASVTLEPIAALQACLQDDMRRMDLALVDVGAGTSDIALVSQGAVQAFGMVPCAGDAITESLCRKFLLDFPSAERVKRSAFPAAVIETTDVFDRPLSLGGDDVLSALAPATTDLAARIAEEILSLSGGHAPQTVFCVGGASLTPGLTERIAQALEIAPRRVKVHAPRALGPETATPLGIAAVASLEAGLRFQRAFVNGRPYFILVGQANRPAAVASALLAAGIPAKQVFGWPGSSKSYTLNGEFRLLRARPVRPNTAPHGPQDSAASAAQPASAARITVNGVPADLDAPLRPEDRIDFTAAQALDEARGTIGEALAPLRHWLTVDGVPRELPIRLSANGRPADLEEPLQDRMRLSIEGTLLRDVLTPRQRLRRCLLNGKAAALNAPVRHGDRVETTLETPAARNDEKPRSLMILANGKPVTLEPRGSNASPILAEALCRIPLGPVPAGRKKLRLLLNGTAAQFTSPLHDGAEVRVFFE